MRRLKLFVYFTLMSCSLYDFENILTIEFTDLQSFYTTSFPEIHYQYIGSFYIDVRLDYLNNQTQWVPAPELSRKLITSEGLLKWDQPLQNTRYRMQVRPISYRGGSESKIDVVVKEEYFEVVLQPVNITSVTLHSVDKIGQVPISAKLTVDGIGIRPSSLLALLDVSFRPIFYSSPNSIYLTYLPSSPGKLAIFVAGYGVKSLDLGGGVERWIYTVSFGFHNPSFLCDGINEFKTGEDIYILLDNSFSLDFDSSTQLGQVFPNQGTSLATWMKVTWL